MNKRTVEFTIGDGVITPSVPLYGGVKGEHNATQLVIHLEEGVYSVGDVARLSFTTGDGTVVSSDVLNVTASGTYIEYDVPQLLTIASGQLCARLVISKITNDEEVQTYRSPEMVLYFEEASVENGTPFWTGVSQMLSRTVTAKDAAEAASDSAMAYESKAREDATLSAQQAALSKGYAQSSWTASQSASEAASSAWEAANTVGEKGKSAYEIAVDAGFEGDEAAWLASLKGDTGAQGIQGEKGEKGDPYTLTDTDKAAIVADVSEVAVAKNQGAANVGKILAVGTDGNLVLVDMPEGSTGANGDVIGTLDDSNNILLTGALADGTYTLKYENEDGTYSDIGTLEVGAIPEPEEIVNQIPISIDSSGAVYNGTGYASGVRLSSDGVTEKSSGTKACVLTGYIPVVGGDVIRMQNITVGADSDTTYVSYLWLYDSSFAKVSHYMYTSSEFTPTEADGISSFTVPSDTGVTYMRVQAQMLDDTSIITVNQEIA